MRRARILLTMISFYAGSKRIGIRTFNRCLAKIKTALNRSRKKYLTRRFWFDARCLHGSKSDFELQAIQAKSRY